MEIEVGMLVCPWGLSRGWKMASTCASRKSVEDAEIFQVLEESTDSDVTLFSPEEDEDGNEPDSDEDLQMKIEALVLAAQKLLIWNGLMP